MSAPGTRQSRGRARRAAVLEAARRLFASQGFKGSSLAAIAQEAGITDAGLLYHFPTKNDLLLAVVAEGDREHEKRQRPESRLLLLVPLPDHLRADPAQQRRRGPLPPGARDIAERRPAEPSRQRHRKLEEPEREGHRHQR